MSDDELFKLERSAELKRRGDGVMRAAERLAEITRAPVHGVNPEDVLGVLVARARDLVAFWKAR